MSSKPIAIRESSVGGVNCRLFSALTPKSSTYCGLLLICVNYQTGEEEVLDILLPDDRLATVLSAIRKILGVGWTLYESFELESFGPLLPKGDLG